MPRSSQLQMAFVHTPAQLLQRSFPKRERSSSASHPAPFMCAFRSNRREVLSLSALSLLSASTLTFLNPTPAHADRTGKYSTKLTAKRRYLPRISRGARALESLSDEALDLDEFLIDTVPDFVPALRLFATSFFSEGNRVGAVERELTELVDVFENAVAEVKNARKKGNEQDLKNGCRKAVDAVNEYVRVAKIEESVPLLKTGVL